jgi:hypothetical protein
MIISDVATDSGVQGVPSCRGSRENAEITHGRNAAVARQVGLNLMTDIRVISAITVGSKS